MSHIHADLMKQYAEDAAKTDTPWELWEVKGGKSWVSLADHPLWLLHIDYRRKPVAVTTHKVNGYQVPAPETKSLAYGTIYYISLTTSTSWVSGAIQWNSDEVDTKYITRGLVFLVKEHAIMNAKAMCNINPFEN